MKKKKETIKELLFNGTLAMVLFFYTVLALKSAYGVVAGYVPPSAIRYPVEDIPVIEWIFMGIGLLCCALYFFNMEMGLRRWRKIEPELLVYTNFFIAATFNILLTINMIPYIIVLIACPFMLLTLLVAMVMIGKRLIIHWRKRESN